MCRPDPEVSPGDVRLVAYVILKAQHSLDFVQMSTHLRLTLPDYGPPTSGATGDSS